jgi:dihydrolipoamide dehydrogenase
MPDSEKRYDLAVIGAGPGGYSAALEAAGLGMSVILIEQDQAGGTCLNRGCIPTKALLHASGLQADLKKSGFFSAAPESLQPDFKAVADYRDESVSLLREGLLKNFRAHGVEFVQGTGKIKAAGETGVVIEIESAEKEDGDAAEKCSRTTVRAGYLILATGSHAVKLPVPGMDLPGVMTSDGFLKLKSLPQSAVIIGGGVIGCEFACFLNEMGVRVTILEALPRILNNMDREISQSLKMIFRKRNVEICTGLSVKRVEKNENGNLSVFCGQNPDDGKETEFTGEIVISAAGRRANLTGFFAEDSACSEESLKTERGRIVTNGDFETSLQHVYAAGDAAAGIQLAHKAMAEGKHIARLIAAGSGKNVPEDPCLLSLVPACVYTNPEIASVGMTEEEAKNAGIRVKCGKALNGANAKSVISREERGFMKFVAEEETGKIIGAQFMCARASDMIGEAALMIANGLKASDCLKSMRAHPTYEEMMTDALESTDRK